MTEDGRPVPTDDTDLSGMSFKEARAYVVAFLQTLKETQKRKAEFVEDLELWNSRIALAEKSGKADLLQAARSKEKEIREDLAHLEVEEEELAEKVRKLKRNLKRVAGQFNYSVDTSQLQASLDMLVDDKETSQDDLLNQLKEQKAKSDLDELKRRMGKEVD